MALQDKQHFQNLMKQAQKDVINLNFILHFSTNKSGLVYDVQKKSLKRANVAKRYYYVLSRTLAMLQ